ncbi:MAG: HAD-IIIC family phosphatase, partial [Candidatus Xenobia bacterium]
MPTLMLCGTFAIEPIAEVISYWLQAVGISADIAVAPFGQVVEPLLDPHHRDAFRVVLLGPDRPVAELFEPSLVVLPPGHAGSPHALSADEVFAAYRVSEWQDPYRQREASIPYTPAAAAAIGTAVARRFIVAVRPVCKVVVLDCDGTLWDGECAQGPVRIDTRHRMLAQRMRELVARGVLLCLCSKNAEADVRAVFEQSALTLCWSDLAAWRINWRPKSENLASLAQELGLGLDGFVFIDDNPLECAEVRSACPAVQTFCLDDVPRFLQHCWALDLPPQETREDRERTPMMAQQRERYAACKQAPDLAAFIAGLHLEIDVQEMREEHLARVAQLSLRTNQFNLSGKRWTVEALRQCGLRGLVASVRDRFGDYGLVGALLHRAREVDSFYLSCRALQRGVEHRMLAALGPGAIRLPLVRTERNAPIGDFLEQVGVREGDVYLVESPERIRWEPTSVSRSHSVIAAASCNLEMTVQLATGDAIAEAIRKRRLTAVRAPFRAPATSHEAEILGLFRELFGADDIGMDDDFFALGGHSLLATQLMACIGDLPLHVLFEAPTPAQLAVQVQAVRGQAAPLQVDASSAHHPFPLTPLQQAYLIGRTSWLGLGNVGTHNYVELDYVDLDLARYAAAWQATISRHAALRTVIVEGQQRVLEAIPPYRIVLTEDDPHRVREQMSHQLLPVDRWPTFEIRATRLDARRTRIHTSFDGIMLDLWSTRMVFREVGERYRQPDKSWPELPWLFRDFVLHQAEHRDEAAHCYWEARLDTLPPAPRLPLACDPQTVTRPRFARLFGTLDAARWSRLSDLARKHRLTESGLVMALFCDVLARWSASPRFTLNLTLLHRPPIHPQIHPVAGDFTSLI